MRWIQLQFYMFQSFGRGTRLAKCSRATATALPAISQPRQCRLPPFGWPCVLHPRLRYRTCPSLIDASFLSPTRNYIAPTHHDMVPFFRDRINSLIVNGLHRVMQSNGSALSILRVAASLVP